MPQRLPSHERLGMGWRRRARRFLARMASRRGSSLVEFTFLLPFLVLLLLGVIDFGRAFYLSIEVNNAAYAAALYGVQNSAASTVDLENAAIADAADVPSPGITFPTPPVYGCECADGTSAAAPCPSSPPTCSANNLVTYVQVTTAYTYKPLFPWPGIPASIPLQGYAWLRTGT